MHMLRQDELYHCFADQRMIFGVPNFSNVVSNAAFLIAAIYAVRGLAGRFTEQWERRAYATLLLGVAMPAFGSSYYHLRPATQTSAGAWWTLILHGFAKIVEVFDRDIGRVIATGGHPWKHVAGAAAIRQPLSDGRD